MRYDHVGIATRDATALADTYSALLDVPVVHEERFDGMSVVFLELDNGYFELLEPEDDGTIARFLDERGSGIHHVALATDDVSAALARAREHDIQSIDDEPRPGAWGHQVAFLHPTSTGGVLIEFVEH